MDGNTVVGVVRQVTIEYNIIAAAPLERTPLIVNQPVIQAPPSRKHKDAFIIVFLYAVGISLMVFGAVYVNECPAEKMIPISLIILGIIFIIPRLVSCVHDYRSVTSEYSVDHPPYLIWIKVIFGLGGISMFIALCYWSFSTKVTMNPEDHGLPNYCNENLYKTAFWGCVAFIFSLPVLLPLLGALYD